MSSPQQPTGAPNADNADNNSGASKRTASDTPPGPPMKVARRVGPTGVEVEKNEYWDKASPKPIPGAEMARRRFLNAARRWEQLKKYNLLYKYSKIKVTEIRLLYIKPAMKRESPIFVTIKKIGDHAVGREPLQEYEALSYHWGPGPADKPVYVSSLSDQDSPTMIDIGAFSDVAKLGWFVPDYSRGQRLYVRPNLDKALRYLRSEKDTVILWVDAICINQADEKVEKPGQIAKMQHIYNQASNVCIWLGDGKGDSRGDRSDDFRRAMKFSREILNIKKVKELSQDPNATKRWSDLLDLMRCSWFSRRWVIQELALAREATVHCGDECVHWQDFADAIGLFVVHFDRIRALFRKDQRDDKIFRNYKSFNELEPLGAKVLVDAITNTFRKSVDGTLFEPVFDLETLVTSLSTFESSDPRDTIFALLNIARESLLPESRRENEIGPPKPDYESDLLEVYTDFLKWVVHSNHSIDIICRPWAIPERTQLGGWKNPTPVVQLPSWIQTNSKSPWGTQEQGFNGRVNGDSLVGRAGRRRYNASHGMPPKVRFGQRKTRSEAQQSEVPPPADLGNSVPSNFAANDTSADLEEDTFDGPDGKESSLHRLRVRGVEIDKVTWLHGPVSRGVITKECLQKGGWKYVSKNLDKVPDKLWRTLVANRTADGDNPPPWYHRAALHFMAYTDNNGHIAVREILDQGGPENDKLPPIVEEYFKRVQAVTWNRKFLEGTEQTDDSKQLFGIGPPDTQIDDSICILFGCSVPCILRPCLSRNGIKYWEFIGEAYIHGRMDGEAITMLSRDDLKEQTTEFVLI